MRFDIGILLKMEPLLRRAELEADGSVLPLDAPAGYRPDEMAGFVRNWVHAEGAAPALVSTHPAGEARLRALERGLPLARGVWARFGQECGPALLAAPEAGDDRQ